MKPIGYKPPSNLTPVDILKSELELLKSQVNIMNGTQSTLRSDVASLIPLMTRLRSIEDKIHQIEHSSKIHVQYNGRYFNDVKSLLMAITSSPINIFSVDVANMAINMHVALKYLAKAAGKDECNHAASLMLEDFSNGKIDDIPHPMVDRDQLAQSVLQLLEASETLVGFYR